jgi:hypothetical protein
MAGLKHHRLQWQKLAYIILVEPLAYQFASPVRWIEIHDHLFTDFNLNALSSLVLLLP